MNDYEKPLPAIQPWSRKFWEGTKQNKLLIQECKGCSEKIFYPRKTCPECWSSDLDWSEASGRGKIYTYTVTLGGVEKKFAGDLPYVLAYVDLEEGIRMMTRIVECDPEAVAIGMDVEVVFEAVTEDITLPLFRPIQ
ncbi:MAG: Zn-ribbon domain-containing OB-fold protein [Deltaproteobacteria bacterium]|nr:Zn-ribbon domain-containing OB-fold protein [Deltaproteobacteria bacterium]